MDNGTHLIREEKIALRHLTIAAKVWGESSSRKILAIHGWLDNAASFERLAPLIENAEVVAIDLPGHGLSDHLSEDATYYFADYVDIVYQLIEALQWEGTILLGHSLGASVASLFAGTFPEMVQQLVLIDAIGALEETPANTASRLRHAIEKEAALYPARRRHYSSFEAAVLARKADSALTFEEAELLAKRGVSKSVDGYYWHHDPKHTLPSKVRFSYEQVVSFLAQIEAKTCLIRAEDGILQDEDKLSKYTSKVEQCQTHILPGGHHIHIQSPHSVAKIINNHLLV